tara:strand:+ start:334 stop:537 length:204 start_codon:yes stop_codon:yes gene_type:complete
MQHGIGDGQRTKHMRLSTIFAFAPSSVNTTLPLIDVGQHLIVPQEKHVIMQSVHPVSDLGELTVLPS